ncbi:MAG: hydrogenase large subunit [Thermoplasmata archaeon]|nr:hydrogenase large subunit [Thermoplasmata archaeon]
MMIIETNNAGFAEECSALRDAGHRLMTMFAEHSGRVHALFRKGADVTDVTHVPEGKAVPLSPSIPCAMGFERLMAESDGVEFEDGPRAPLVLRKEGSIPRNHTVGEDVFEIPVGPVHAGIIEPGHFRFSVAGEPVIELNPTLGFTHRGVERLLEGPASKDDSRLVERISGDTCVANCIAYSEIMESGAEIPVRARHIRVVLAEMERLHAHIGTVSGVCTDTAFCVPSAVGGGIHEKLLRMNVGLTGHRLLMNSVVPGGVRRDIPPETLMRLDDFLMEIKFEMEELASVMMESPALLDRLEGTGVLKKSDAEELGMVGPIARASGVESDVRAELPYEMYGSLGMRVVTEPKGDVHARTLVRLGEITESISLIHQCIQSMEPGETRVRVTPKDGVRCAVVEAPRGELVHCAVIEDGKISRYNVRDPSFMDWPGMSRAVPGNVVPDFPLINKSFSLSYSGNDL